MHKQLVQRNPCAIVERPTPAAARQNQARGLSEPQVLTLLGAARGRGRCARRRPPAEACAREMGLAVEIYPARWDRHGRSAGYRRSVA